MLWKDEERMRKENSFRYLNMKTKKIFAALTAVCLSAQAAGLTAFAETIVPDEGTDGSSSASTQPAGTTVPDPTNTSPVSPEPAEPVTPPAAPEQPDAPAEPEAGQQPEAPDQPDQPQPPENPETPEAPDKPDNPDDPENPVDPENPEAPENPEVPNAPAEPEQPEEPSEKPAEPAEPEQPATPEPAPVQPAPVAPYEPALPDNPSYTIPSGPYAPLKVINTMEDARLTIPGLGDIRLLPDFNNARAWKGSSSSYNTPGLWGQCTWFAWGRFYEIYGFDPGFTGNGNQCVDQLLTAHPDKFEKSDMPKAGAVFSSDYAHNHVGLVLAVDEEQDLMLIQEANFDGVSNPVWNEAILDWKTSVVTPEILKQAYGEVTYANPKLDDQVPENNHEFFRARAKELESADYGDLEFFSFDEVEGVWSGQPLNRTVGTIMGPSGKETYYNLPMSGVVNIMRSMGNKDLYWVRADGCKMLGRYIMVAADLRVHPRGSLVETSLGTGIVCDTGEFALSNPYQIDIAVAWK